MRCLAMKGKGMEKEDERKNLKNNRSFETEQGDAWWGGLKLNQTRPEPDPSFFSPNSLKT